MTKQNNININMSWDKEVIAAEQKSERSLLIELTGEGDLKTKHKERPPVNLAIVIDCSGSMEASIEPEQSITIAKLTGGRSLCLVLRSPSPVSSIKRLLSLFCSAAITSLSQDMFILILFCFVILFFLKYGLH